MRKYNDILDKKSQKTTILNDKYLQKYGVTYTEVIDDVNKHKKSHRGYPYLKKLFRYIRDEKARFILFFIALFFCIATSLVVPFSMQYIIDYIMVSNWNMAIVFAIVYGCSFFCSQMLYMLGQIIVMKSSQKIAHNLRVDLGNNILNTKKQKFDDVNTGEIINRISNDPQKLLNDIVMICVLCFDFLESLIFITYMFCVDYQLTLILFLVGVSRFLIVSVFNKKIYKRNERRCKIITDKNTGLYNEVVRGNSDIKNLNLKAIMFDKLKRVSIFAYNSNYDSANQKNNNLKLSVIVYRLLFLVFMLVSVYKLSIGTVNLSTVVVLFTYCWYFEYLFECLSNIHSILQTSEVNMERIYQILDDDKYPKEKFGTKTLDNPKGEIEFKNVCFRYNDKMSLFENLSFKIMPGETIGIAGKSGEGKSTIINLIPRLYEIDSGQILIDGVDIKDLTESCLRNIVGTVPQSPYIFNTTIKENLLYAKADATDEEIIDVCKKAQIHDIIMQKPDGYNTKVGEGGIMLSGGQQQRLAIARALLKDCKILLMDEATSALDNKNQNEIKKVINNIGKERTVITVAHRLNTIEDCDRILIVYKGKIVGDGNHDNLLKTCKVFGELYQIEE